MILNDPNVNTPRLCGCQSGDIVVRRCGNPALSQCGRCGVGICADHAGFLDTQAQQAYCPPCLLAIQQNNPTDEGGEDYGDNLDSTFQFWPGSSRSSFTDEDYATFDALSDFDKRADDGHAYDS
jgi:hypothetical protein